MTLESAVGADVNVGVVVGVGAYGDSVMIRGRACSASARVTCGVNDETEARRAGTVTLEPGVGADVDVGICVGVGAYGDSVVIRVRACDAYVCVACGVND